jgi:hypothetical protein
MNQFGALGQSFDETCGESPDAADRGITLLRSNRAARRHQATMVVYEIQLSRRVD